VLFLMMNMNVSDQRTRGNRRLVLVEDPGWMRVALGDRQSGLVGLGGFESLSEAVTSLLRRALAALADRPALPRGDR
jgi:hypothetical protein